MNHIPVSKVRVIVQVKKISMTLRFNCKLSFLIKNELSQKLAESDDTYPLIRGECLINQALYFEIPENLFDNNCKKIKLIVMMISANGMVPAGFVNFNTHHKQPYTQFQESMLLQRCQDHKAQIKFMHMYENSVKTTIQKSQYQQVRQKIQRTNQLYRGNKSLSTQYSLHKRKPVRQPPLLQSRSSWMKNAIFNQSDYRLRTAQPKNDQLYSHYDENITEQLNQSSVNQLSTEQILKEHQQYWRQIVKMESQLQNLRQQNKTIRSKNICLSDDYEKLKLQFQSDQQKIHALVTQIRLNNDSTGNLSSQLQYKKKIIAEKQQRQSQLHKQLTAKQTQLQKALNERNTIQSVFTQKQRIFNQKISQYDHNLEKLQTIIHKSQSIQQESQQKINKISFQLQENQQKYETCQQELQSKVKEYLQLSQKLQMSYIKINQLQQRENMLKNKNDQFQGVKEDYQRQLMEIKQFTKEKINDQLNLSKEINALKKSSQQKQKILNQYSQEKLTKERQITALQEALKISQTQIVQLLQKNNVDQSEIKQTKQKSQNLETMIQNLIQQTQVLTKQLDLLRKEKINNQEALRKQAELKIKDLSLNLQIKSKELQKKQQQLQIVLSAKAASKQELEIAINHYTSLQQKLAQYNRKIAEYQTKLAESQENKQLVSKLQNLLTKQKQQFNAKSIEIQKADIQKKLLLSKLEGLTKQIEQVKTFTKEKITRQLMLTKQNNSLKQKIKELQQSNSNFARAQKP